MQLRTAAFVAAAAIVLAACSASTPGSPTPSPTPAATPVASPVSAAQAAEWQSKVTPLLDAIIDTANSDLSFSDETKAQTKNVEALLTFFVQNSIPGQYESLVNDVFNAASNFSKVGNRLDPNPSTLDEAEGEESEYKTAQRLLVAAIVNLQAAFPSS